MGLGWSSPAGGGGGGYSEGDTILAADGTSLAPSFSFSNDTDTGMYLLSAGTLAFATAGSKRFQVSSSSFNAVSLAVRSGSGNAGSPGFNFSSDGDTGMFRQTTNTLGLSAGGVQFFRGEATQATSLMPFIFPSMDNTARDALTPVAGMVIFNTSDDALNVYTSGGWELMDGTST